MELYEHNLSVINGSDIEIIVDDNNIDENWKIEPFYWDKRIIN